MRHRNLSSFVRTNTPFANIVKSVDETRVSTEILADDSELKFKARSNKTYFIKLFLFVNSGVSPDFKYSLSIPSGSAIRNQSTWDPATFMSTADWTAVDIFASDGLDQMLAIIGKFENGVTAGQVAIQWAQNSSNVANTTILKGSFMEVWEL